MFDLSKRFDPMKMLNYGRKKKPYTKYPSFNRRMMAVTADSIILLLALPIINRLAPINTRALESYTVDPGDQQASRHLAQFIIHNEPLIQSWISNFFLQMLAWSVFSAICLHFWSATPGKMLFRMKVVDAKTEGRISDFQVFLRSFGYFVSVSVFCLGFFWINLNKRRRGWHDYLADTVVIDLPIQWKRKAPETPKEPAKETE